MAERLRWQYTERIRNVQAPLSYADAPYVISHRLVPVGCGDRLRGHHTLSYRPTGQHVPLGSFPTFRAAKQAAEEHHAATHGHP